MSLLATRIFCFGLACALITIVALGRKDDSGKKEYPLLPTIAIVLGAAAFVVAGVDEQLTMLVQQALNNLGEIFGPAAQANIR